MKLLLNEVLQKVSNAKTKAQKIKLLRELNSPALRSILIANFDESVVSMLPDGEVPYTPNDAPEETEHTVLNHEYRKLYLFFKGGANISQTRRESLFIQLLEGLHKGEAEVLCLMKDKKIGKRWKITKQCVEEAFPAIEWGNRS
jgi:hypothetical protein|tara:strand:- start:94 stop:525 length:432 start_codon:yes stop_codon:yes gene_type:complete